MSAMRFHTRMLQAIIRIISVAVVVALAWGCASSGKYVFHSDIKSVKNIAVFPVISMEGAPAWAAPEDTRAAEASRAQKGGAVFMTDYMVGRLSSMPSMTVKIMPAITRNDVIDMQEGRFGIELPKEVDSFILCRLYSFRDRRGGDYAVQSPSRVAFDIRVVQASSGQTLFFSEYDETQKPLLDNVLGLGLFFKRKGRWITAREMAEMALSDILGQWEKQIQ